MRHILLSCVILLLALAFCLFSMLHVRDICRKTLDLLSSAQTAAERNDFETCRASMQDAALHWKRYERYFGLALRHEEVDDVISRFAAKDFPLPGVPKISPFGFLSCFLSQSIMLLERAFKP